MEDCAVTAPLDWTHDVKEIGKDGLARRKEATPEERARLAKELRIPEVIQLSASYTIRARAGGSYALSGEITADVIQECIVSLAPVPTNIAEPFEAEFWPPETIPSGEEGEIDALSAAEIEPLEGGAIDAGRIVFETLAAALDPYPRAPGAVFDWSDPASAESAKQGPFAALGALKKRD